jgi:hypothetical protein
MWLALLLLVSSAAVVESEKTSTDHLDDARNAFLQRHIDEVHLLYPFTEDTGTVAQQLNQLLIEREETLTALRNPQQGPDPSTVYVKRDDLNWILNQLEIAKQSEELKQMFEKWKGFASYESTARAEYAREMHAIDADIDSSFTADDDELLTPVSEYALRLLKK